jgi:ubiquinone/menaquinone biosynthesis C-methylase UbiE
MDVNDYCEKTLEWGEKSNDISKNVEPYADSEGLSILEIGSGTGAYSRHLIKYSNRLILTDPNDGFILFLKNYFKNIRSRGDSIHIIKNDGFSFPGVADKSIDMVFGGGGLFFYKLVYINVLFSRMSAYIEAKWSVRF